MTTMRKRVDRNAHDQAIPLRGNVRVRTLHKGRVVDQYRGHNIFLNVGRDWLIQQISFGAYPPVVGAPPPAAALDRRIAFMAVGCGGVGQTNPADQAWVVANVNPGATFLQDDTDVTKTGLEVPAFWAAGKYAKPIISVDYSLPVSGYSVWVRYTALWTVGEINSEYGGAPVPITEAAMYPHLLDGLGNVKEFIEADVQSAASSYETFRPVWKETDFELEIQWTYRV